MPYHLATPHRNDNIKYSTASWVGVKHCERNFFGVAMMLCIRYTNEPLSQRGKAAQLYQLEHHPYGSS